MANRILRDWTNSENIDKLSLLAEVLFIRLIMKADDFGCFYGNPKLLTSHLFPLKDIAPEKISEALSELISNKIVTYYKSEDRLYVQINNFGQRLRAMNSKFPQPDSTNITNDSEARTIDSNLPPETKGSRNEVETEGEVEDETKKKFAEKISASLHSELKKMFLDFYLNKTTSEYYWEAKDGKALNSIIAKLLFKIKEKNPALKKESEEIEIKNGFRHFLAGIKDKWILENLSMTILSSKFNEIINQIINPNGKSISNNNKKVLHDYLKTELNSGHNK